MKTMKILPLALIALALAAAPASALTRAFATRMLAAPPPAPTVSTLSKTTAQSVATQAMPDLVATNIHVSSHAHKGAKMGIVPANECQRVTRLIVDCDGWLDLYSSPEATEPGQHITFTIRVQRSTSGDDAYWL